MEVGSKQLLLNQIANKTTETADEINSDVHDRVIKYYVVVFKVMIESCQLNLGIVYKNEYCELIITYNIYQLIFLTRLSHFIIEFISHHFIQMVPRKMTS